MTIGERCHPGLHGRFLLLNAASPQRLAQVGKQPVHPISGHSLQERLRGEMPQCGHT